MKDFYEIGGLLKIYGCHPVRARLINSNITDIFRITPTVNIAL